MPAIVRCLWGDPKIRCRTGKVIKKDVRKRLSEGCDCKEYVYVYGKANLDVFAGDSSREIILVDPSPFPDGIIDSPHPDTGKMKRPWQNKWRLIKRAMEDHDRIQYLDWDVRNLCKSPDEPDDLLQGRTMAFSAFQYRRIRKYLDRQRKFRKIAVSGNSIYLTDRTVPDEVLSRFDWNDWIMWHDEAILTRWLDELLGSWTGSERWLRHFESPVVCQRNGRSPWRLVSNDGRTVKRETPIEFTWTRLFQHV